MCLKAGWETENLFVVALEYLNVLLEYLDLEKRRGLAPFKLVMDSSPAPSCATPMSSTDARFYNIAGTMIRAYTIYGMGY